MHLFTLFMDFRGGTYISQISALDIRSALKQWAEEINSKKIAHFGETSKKELREKILLDTCVPVKDVKNVWCSGAALKTGCVFVHIVRTEH